MWIGAWPSEAFLALHICFYIGEFAPHSNAWSCFVFLCGGRLRTGFCERCAPPAGFVKKGVYESRRCLLIFYLGIIWGLVTVMEIAHSKLGPAHNHRRKRQTLRSQSKGAFLGFMCGYMLYGYAVDMWGDCSSIIYRNISLDWEISRCKVFTNRT
jgi:hypothetical protein